MNPDRHPGRFTIRGALAAVAVTATLLGMARANPEIFRAAAYPASLGFSAMWVLTGAKRRATDRAAPFVRLPILFLAAWAFSTLFLFSVLWLVDRFIHLK